MSTDERTDALLDAERVITARLAGYNPATREGRLGIAATNMAALVVKRLRTGETQTEIAPGFVVVPESPTEAMIEAAARAIACGEPDNRHRWEALSAIRAAIAATKA